jgi:hypothetical protein
MGCSPFFGSITAPSAGFVSLPCPRHWKKKLATVSPELSRRRLTRSIDSPKPLSADSRYFKFPVIFLRSRLA